MRLRILTTLIAGLLTWSFVVSAQKPNKFEDAQQRSEDAGRIISVLAVLPDTDLPKEVVDKAHAIAVFPKVKKESMLFGSFSQGYGVISARTETGWTMPAFYEFSGGGYGAPFAGAEINGIMMIFMTKDAVSWFEKGGVKLKGAKKAIEGPVGKITDEQRKEVEGAHILAYAYHNGRLSGKAFGTSFWKTFHLNPDNKINTPLYGIKGREVLAGKKIESPVEIPVAIPKFTEALDKYYGVVKTSASG